MPINIGPSGSAFNLQIPEFSENADIQAAFKLYHYGSPAPVVGSTNPQSLAGYLDSLEKNKINKTPTLIGLSADLNNITESGLYVQTTDSRARTGANYPKIPPVIGFEYAGILSVVNDGNGNIYQEYQIGSIPGQSVYWRAKFGSQAFSPWQGFAREGHVHDDLYYRQSVSDTRYFGAIKFKSVIQPTISSNNYTITKNNEDVILVMNNGSIPHNVIVPQDVANPELNIAPGTTIRIIQGNTGQTSVIAGTASVTLNATSGNRLQGIWSVANLIKIAPNNWVLTGDLQTNRTKALLRNDIGIYVQPNQPVGNIQNGDLWFW
jgi:hypothetical protein